MNILIILAVIALMIALRFAKLNDLAWLAIWWVGLWVILRFGIDPPLPSSIVSMFMFIITIALLAFMSADSERFRSVRQSIVRFMVDKRYKIPLVAILVLLPVLVAVNVYRGMTMQPDPPISSRTIHPPPPVEISFKGKKINLATDANPYRALEETDRAAFDRHVQNGRAVYFENCVYCHGDNMAGDGIFAHGFNPIPANFQDATTIAMLQESYLFWRIAKGAPGLPQESTPWLSAMPAWENFLTEEEIWDVILFLYEYTGQRPRAQEEAH